MGVPPAILERLHREIDAVLQSEEVKRQLAAQGVQTGAMSSAAFAGFSAWRPPCLETQASALARVRLYTVTS